MLGKRFRPRALPRRGFSLIELLIVMAIISMLVAITAAAVFKGYTWATISNTQVLLGKVDKRLAKRNDTLRRDAVEIDVPTGFAGLWPGITQMQGRAIQQKLFIKWSFPRSFREAMLNHWQSRAIYGSNGYNFSGAIWRKLALAFSLPDYTDPATYSYPNNPAPLPAWPTTDAQLITENSACLAIVFELLGSLDELAPNEKSTRPFGLPSLSTPPLASDNSSVQVPVLLDGWGTPLMCDYAPGNPLGSGLSQIRLSYWAETIAGTPAGLRQRAARAFPAKYTGAPGSANSDPDDPEGVLLNLQNAQWQALDVLFNLQPSYWSITFNPGGPNAYPQYAPLVVLSAGPDRTFGFQNNGATLGTAASNALDDLDSYSWRVTTQGQ